MIIHALVRIIATVNPPAYYLMKQAAFARHQVFHEVIEKKDPDTFEDSWHQKALDKMYPY